MSNRRFRGLPLSGIRHGVIGAVIVAGIVCLIAGGTDARAAGDADRPRADTGQPQRRAAFVTHRGPNWSWAGPRNWSAAYGTYGITITSGDGSRALDLGFSNTFCVPADNARQSALRYMARQRRQLRQGGARITAASRIRRVRSFGPNYFRQTVRASANGGRQLGIAIFDYEFARYCYQRSVAMGAPRRGFDASLDVLFSVFNSLAYSGPGSYEDGEGPNES